MNEEQAEVSTTATTTPPEAVVSTPVDTGGKPLIGVDIFRDRFRIRIAYDKDRTVTRTSSISNLRKTLSLLLEDVETKNQDAVQEASAKLVTSPYTRVCTTSATSRKVVEYYPETRRTLTVTAGRGGTGTKHVLKDFLYPNLIAVYVFSKSSKGLWGFQCMRLYATPLRSEEIAWDKIDWDNPRSATHQIYSPPLPNVWGDCKVCTGSGAIVNTLQDDLRVLEITRTMIYDSPFNSDLNIIIRNDGSGFLPSSSNPMHVTACKAMHEFSQTYGVFPYDRVLANYEGPKLTAHLEWVKGRPPKKAGETEADASTAA